MKTLYCIVGRTGAGKDTITAELIKQTGMNKVVSFTDAPIRSDQKNGREHWFLSPEEFTDKMNSSEVLAFTEINGKRYMATLDQIDDKTRFYIIDPEGVKDLKARFGDRIDIVIFYINTPLDVRKKRTAGRGAFDFESRNASEDRQFSKFEKSGDYIEIFNTGTPKDAADLIGKEMFRIAVKGIAKRMREG